MSLEISNESAANLTPGLSLQEVSEAELGVESLDNNDSDSDSDNDKVAKIIGDNDESGVDEEDGAEMNDDDDDDDDDVKSGDVDDEPELEEDTDDDPLEDGVSEDIEDDQKRSSSTTVKNSSQVSDINTMLGLKFPMSEPEQSTVGAYTDTETDTDEDDEEAYLQKLKTHIRTDYILDFHPEMKTHNFDEVIKMAKISRDKYGNITDPFHKTTTTMTKYEKARVLGQRAKQIDQGAKAFVKVASTTIDGYLIALEELKQKKLPFIIRRPLPNGGVEYWPVKELELIH